MQTISVVTPCFNEEDNVLDIYESVKKIFLSMNKYHYEHIFIDNSSTDKTVSILKTIAKKDKSVKIIVNSRNFGWIRSPVYGLFQAKGDAVISIVADSQDPPELIPQFIKKWEEGFKIVIGVKSKSDEHSFLFYIRKMYYKFVKKISEVNLINNFTGFGLYDRSIIEKMSGFGDAYPYFRGMLSEIGFSVAEIQYHQPIRKKGLSKGSLYRLYDVAMLGITTHSKLPLRILTIIGFSFSLISLLISLGYIALKLIFWTAFPLGLAPILIGSFFFFSLQMLFVGILGEYILSIHSQVLNRPLVIEQERVNFN